MRKMTEYNNRTMSNEHKKLLAKITSNIENFAEKTAYIIGNKKITYSQLDDLSNRVVSYIVRSLGDKVVEREKTVRVGIILPRNSHYYACILACVKLGCSYVPIDVASGTERIDYIMENAQLDILIHKPLLDEILSKHITTTSYPDYHKEESEAYLIYTSGSTGKPKGVSMSYSALYNYMQSVGMEDNMHITSDSIILQFASINFDVSVLEMFSAMYYGATLVISQDHERHDASRLIDLIKREKVTFALIPPSLLAIFPTYDMPSLHTLAVAGEALTYNLSSQIAGKYNYRFVNGYGPTESCVIVTVNTVKDADDWRSIGKATYGTVCYVADEEGRLVKPGEMGELLIGGKQVAIGYLNMPEATEKAFFPNPYDDPEHIAPRLYHSGDNVILREDGSFDYVGRIDSQIKLRGFRIELSEILYRLEMHERVSRAFVQLEELGHDKYIVAYIQTTDGNSSMKDIKEYLSWHLNPYMMPTFWNHVKCFPLNTSGKIDRNQLSNNAWLHCQQVSSSLSDDEEKMVRETADIIGISNINTSIDLVEELGLTSIQAMQIPERMRRHGIQVTIETIYRYRSIHEICNHQGEKLAYWYNAPEENASRPVIVVVSGNASFAKLFSMWADALKDDFSIFVIDNYQDILKCKMTDTPSLVAIYEDIVRPIAEKYHIAAYTGFCIGAEQALLLAHRIHNDSVNKPVVLPIEAEMRPQGADPKLFINLNFPNIPDDVNAAHNEIDLNLIETFPLFHYEGTVIPLLADTYNELQTVTPEQMKDVTEEQIAWAHHIFDNKIPAWKRLYPDCNIISLPANHYTTMFSKESLSLIIQAFKSIL